VDLGVVVESDVIVFAGTSVAAPRLREVDMLDNMYMREIETVMRS